MSRRSKDTGDGVSLFPFMSILACLIGILTLMISVTMQIKQIDRQGQTKEDMDRASANRDLKKEAEKIQANLKTQQEKFEREKKFVAELAKIKDAHIALLLKLDELKKAQDPENTDASLQKLIENLKKEIEALKKSRPPLDKRLAELQAELKKRKDTPKPAESVVVRPGGVGVRNARHLFFVECNSTGIVIRPDDKPPVPVSTAAIGTNEAYNQFLDKIKKKPDSMVLFLVRKAGSPSYQWAAGWAESKYGIAIGKLPVPNDGEIDLSLFH